MILRRDLESRHYFKVGTRSERPEGWENSLNLRHGTDKTKNRQYTEQIRHRTDSTENRSDTEQIRRGIDAEQMRRRTDETGTDNARNK